MKKTLTAAALATVLATASVGAHADVVQVNDAELSDVVGQLNLVSVVNAGILASSVVSGANVFVGHSGGTVVNALGGFSGVSVGNTLVGGSVLSGINILGGFSGGSIVNTLGSGAMASAVSAPLGVTAISAITLPFSLNGLGILNLF